MIECKALNPFRIRQPLPYMVVVVPDEEKKQSLERMSQSVMDELNVKTLIIFVKPQGGWNE